MKKLKAGLAVLMAMTIFLTACASKNEETASATTTNVYAQSTNTTAETMSASAKMDGAENELVLSSETILWNGEAIASDENAAVYQTEITETHPDVSEELKDVVNTVVVIREAGVYRISGTRTDAQIRVDLPEGATGNVELILDGLNIECRTAPAILIQAAADTQTTGEASVNIELATGSENIVKGSHVAKYTDENDNKVKFDAAISSAVSLSIDGEGSLKLSADNEGIESKMHLTINGGNIEIDSMDDGLNASEDGVSVITINGGTIFVDASGGSEGDGIDSNGSIIINGGQVIALANEQSQDSGLDSDLGIVINGGTVVATGNMYDDVSAESAQPGMALQFSQSQQKGVPIVVCDEDDQALIAFIPSYNYSVLLISSPILQDGSSYRVYSAGTIEGTQNNGLYTSIEAYTVGTLLQNGGEMSGGRGMGQPPEGSPSDAAGSAPFDLGSSSDGPPMAPPENASGSSASGQMPPKAGGGPRSAAMSGGSATDVSEAFRLELGNYSFYNVKEVA